MVLRVEAKIRFACWNDTSNGVLVHPGLLWVEFEPATVEVDGSLEVRSVPITAHASFNGHDLAVEPLGDRICNAMRAVVHNMRESLMDRIGGADQWLQAGVHDLVVPAAEEGGCCPFAGEVLRGFSWHGAVVSETSMA